ncbi:MAG: hypothetical protein WC748_10465 [Legionellales bacterium]|jgi:CRISPR/Cas system-associated protein endoribonuclease Cas2
MKNKSEFLTLKSVTLSNKTIELLFSTEKKLFARVTQQDGTVTLTSYIEGIPPIVKQDIVTLRNFIDNSHLVVNPSEENGKHSFVIHVNGSLKGGMLSGPFNKASEASDAFSRAKIEQARKDYSSAVNSYREAVTQLEDAKIKKGWFTELAYDRSEQDELNKMLKDAHFNLAVSLVNLDNNIEQLEEALKHFKIAKNSGMQDESRKEIISVHLQLAKKFETQNNPTLQKTHLKEAVELGSDDAKIQLNEIEQKAQMLNIIQHEEGQGHVIRVPWLNTFETGRGIKSTGKLTRVLVENMSLTKKPFQNTIESFEHVIFDQHDLEKITRVETGISMNAGLWHLKAIAEYASKLTLDKSFVYCITGTVCSSPEQDGFSKGKLNDAALLQLKRDGFQKFKDSFGTHFIGGFSSGALFLGCITLKTENEKAARFLKTELTGPATGLLQAGVSIESNFMETIKKSVIKVDITMQGLNLKNFNSSGSVTNLEEMRKRHEQFQESIRDAKNLGPVEAICEPWESLPEVLPFINIPLPIPLPIWNPKVRDPKLTLLEAQEIDSLDYLNALKEFPLDAFILYNLARSLPADGTIKLLDGTTMTDQELYLKAIDLDNKIAEAYYRLAYTFPAEGTIKLLDGTTMTDQELYLKTIDLDNKFAKAYYRLAKTLPDDGTIKLLDGTTMTQQELYLKTIDLDNKFAKAYFKLAYTLPADGTIKLLDGTSMTQQELYLKTINLDNKFANAYFNLAYTLPADGTIKLLDGTSMTKQKLYLKTIDLDNKFAKAYFNLAYTLPADGTIKLLDGTSMTKQKLYLKTIDLDNKNTNAYNNLARTLSADEDVKLLNGSTMNKKTLKQRTDHLKNENSIALNEDAGSSLLSKAAQQNDPVKSIIIQTSSGLKAISTVQSNNNAALPTTLQVQKNDATTLKK